jgi:adenosylcobyric acid synthase
MGMLRIMVQGTASGVGKSSVAAALCAILKERGHRVAPFKAQNISNNSAVCEGGEIARAQAFQAKACGIEPTVHMNPVLLKPTSGGRLQVVLRGKAAFNVDSAGYQLMIPTLREAIAQSFREIESAYDTLVIEGAGSPAELNRKGSDLANMGIAELAQARVVMVGDIDKGGVFAHLYGTLELLAPRDRKRVVGCVINKFRGDRVVLEPGLKELEARSGVPILGVLPFARTGVPEEDTLQTDSIASKIHVVRLPYLANFTDFESVPVRYIEEPAATPPELLILPGSKSTIADLHFLRSRGFDRWIRDRGIRVLGICAGFQMMGRRIVDPHGVESAEPEVEGLGLIDATTTFQVDKVVRRVRAVHVDTGTGVDAYEIHMGRTSVNQGRPMFRIDGRDEGFSNGRYFGTSLHGLFDNAEFCRAFVGIEPAPSPFEEWKRTVERHLDWEKVTG